MRASEDDVLVIPSLGDRTVEHDVQQLLGRHGIRARHSDNDDGLVDNTAERERENYGYGYAAVGGRGDEEMEVDELESDCLPSHTPSRSSSPSPSSHVPMQASPARGSSLSPPVQGYGINSNIVANMNLGLVRSRSRRRTLTRDEYTSGFRGEELETEVDQDLNLAGTCFDPSGGFVYVASEGAVAEWSIRGAEKRWWHDSAWV